MELARYCQNTTEKLRLDFSFSITCSHAFVFDMGSNEAHGLKNRPGQGMNKNSWIKKKTRQGFKKTTYTILKKRH